MRQYRIKFESFAERHPRSLSFGEGRYTCFLLLIFICSLFFSCTQIDAFEKNIPITNYQWRSSFVPKGSFIIADTVSSYNIYLVLRHTDSYKYNNIWLNLGMQPPGDTMYHQRLDLQLGNDINGWEGAGMNDIWEVRKLLNTKPKRFKKPGIYHFSIAHIMRDDPLPHVMSVGLRVEKK